MRSPNDFDALLRAGADKYSVNSGAVANPELIGTAARRFGSQCVVLSVDARRSAAVPSGFEVTTHGGRRNAQLDLMSWVQLGQELGAGELVINSMDVDGMRTGFDLEMIAAVRHVTTIPLVASGGAGRPEHFVDGARAGADALLAAGIFHAGLVSVHDAKSALHSAGFAVR